MNKHERGEPSEGRGRKSFGEVCVVACHPSEAVGCSRRANLFSRIGSHATLLNRPLSFIPETEC